MPYRNAEDKLAAQRAYRQTLAGKQAQWRYLHSDLGKAMKKRVKARRKPVRFYPFIGVDGEGGGKDELGRQHYRLLRAGDYTLFHDNDPLSSIDCLDFLCNLRPNRLYVSYYFDYDITQILRDLPAEKLSDLISRRALAARIENGKSDTILWRNYEIGWFPRKHLKVRRVDSKNRPVGKWVTIHDCGTFFQTSFVNALEQWGVLTPEQREQMRRDKARRNEFEFMGIHELAYNKLECEALAELMTNFRAVCLDLDYIPSQWEGPGYLASAMMSAHKVTPRKDLSGLQMPLLKFANEAYYGGRFEITRVGWVRNVREYDICSAYPASYLALPCLVHGQWTWHDASDPLPDDGLFVAHLRYSHRDDAPVLCNLPHRLKSGSLVWQREGRGKYWSNEIRAAVKAGTVIREHYGYWHYEKQCDCRPFGDWVQEVYQKRLAIGKSVQGYPLKLALNSIYGKCVQSIGRPPFANPMWGGLITAATRTRLIEGYTGIDPNRVIMLATDGLYVKGGALEHLPIGNQLGDWEQSEPDDIFLIKPGMYAWKNGKKIKTRGVPKVEFQKRLAAVIEGFEDWCFTDYLANRAKDGFEWYSFTMPQNLFIGTRLALARGKPELAGKWTTVSSRQSFDPRIKRSPRGVGDDACILTAAHLGSPSIESIPYNKVIGGAVSAEYREMMKDVLSVEPFQAQVEAENYALLISGLDDATLFDDDEDDDLDVRDMF